MTGLDPERDALLEVAVARVEGGVVVERYATLLRTDVPSVPGAMALHGIDAAAVADAPEFADVAPRLAALIDGAVPVMHGVDLDVRFLDRAFAAAGLDRQVGPTLDTVRLARRALHARHYSLSALCGSLGLGPVRWHRAAEDVLLWESAPNTYKRIDEARLLAALAATPPQRRPEQALPPSGARSATPRLDVGPAWNTEAWLAGVQADHAREAASMAAFDQALREGLKGTEPGPG